VATNTHPAQLSLFEQVLAEDSSLSDEQVIAAICEQMLSDADARAPVDVELLASVCGIDEVRYRPQEWAGMLFSERGRLVAQVRAGDGHERRRFTVLHEGGHTFLPGFLRARQHRCKGPKTREEQLCDIAAAEMLFPRAQFARDLAAAGQGLKEVEALARTYQASIESTALATVRLAREPVMLLNLRLANKPSERGRELSCPPKLRLQWASSSGDWPFPLRDKSVGEGSLLARAWEGELVDERANLDEVLAHELGETHVEARRYGNRVLAVVRPAQRRRC